MAIMKSAVILSLMAAHKNWTLNLSLQALAHPQDKPLPISLFTTSLTSLGLKLGKIGPVRHPSRDIVLQILNLLLLSKVLQ